MVVNECKFDAIRDMKAVEQFGFIDLKDALINNCVPSQVGEGDNDYNGIENPASILGKPSDVFDALAMSEAALQMGSKDDGKSDE